MAGANGRDLLEREAELDVLTTLLTRAQAGSGGTILVEGEAGVGKTALLERTCERAATRGMTVLRARGGELEREFTWGVVHQLFEAFVTARSAAREPLALTGSAALAEPVFNRNVEPGSAPGESFATLHGLYWLTVEIASDGPVLLAVDDLHWSDRPSLRFAVHLASRLEGLPIALLATLRPLGSDAATDVELLGRLVADPAVEHLWPAPLSRDACSELVRRRLSETADPEFCRACHEMCRGNPFLLEALTDALRSENTQATAEGAERVRRMTPQTVARSVLVRLAALPAGCLTLVRAIAVLGTEAAFGEARRLAELDRDEAIKAGSALARAGIVRGEAIVEFVHPLVRSAIYGDLSPAERARWHGRAAKLRASDGASVEEIVPHLLASFPDGDPETVDMLRQAAAHMRAQGAPELAAVYLSRALAEPPASAARAEVLLALGEAEALQQPEQAIAHLSEALACAGNSQDRARICLRLGDALAASGQLPEAIAVFDRGLVELGDVSGEMRAHLEAARLAAARWDRPSQTLRHRAVAELEARLASGERLDPLLDAQLALEIAATGRQREAAIEHARRALKSAPEHTHSAFAVPEVSLVLTFAGLPEEAWQAAQGALARARRLGWPVGIATASTCAALTAVHLGWISEAVATARGAITPGTEIQVAPITVAFLVEALIDRGDHQAATDELARRGLDGELALIWPTTPLLLARGRLRAAAGDHSGAIDDLMATGDRVAEWGLSNPAMTPWRSSAVMPLLATDQRTEAIRLATEELELAQRWGAARAIGVAERALGAALGGQQGVELLAQAATTLRDAHSPVEQARSLFDLGAALRRVGARSEARERLRECLDLAHRHGAIALADQAREELLIAGARPRRDALRGRDALTSSELRVARLAAEGRTNKEIAQLLFITQRTVETHLTSGYAKLGIGSRRDLDGALRGPEQA